MAHDAQLTVDQLLDHAVEIFQELAGDNLNDSLKALFNEQFDARGALCSRIPGDDWQSYMDTPLDPRQQLEITIGLVNEQEQFDTVFARLLLSRDPGDRSCHIRWSD